MRNAHHIIKTYTTVNSDTITDKAFFSNVTRTSPERVDFSLTLRYLPSFSFIYVDIKVTIHDKPCLEYSETSNPIKKIWDRVHEHI